MRALVTGGAGYVGGVVASLLVDQGHDVVVVDDLRGASRAAVPPGTTFHELAVGDGPAIAELLADAPVDVCLHFAGSIEAGLSMQRPEAFFENNVAQTLVLLRALVDANVSRFVFSSSAAVYGDPLTTPIDESHRTQAVSAYGESKLLIEHALAWLARLGRLRYAALRYFNAAGASAGRAERHDPETHLIPIALSVAAGERDSLDLYGDDYPTPDGTCIRDYVHVADLADAHVAAIGALDDRDALVVNLGTGTGASVAEVLAAVREATAHPVPARVSPRRPGDPSELVAANALAHEVLGWSPTRTLDVIVRDAWAASTTSNDA